MFIELPEWHNNLLRWMIVSDYSDFCDCELKQLQCRVVKVLLPFCRLHRLYFHRVPKWKCILTNLNDYNKRNSFFFIFMNRKDSFEVERYTWVNCQIDPHTRYSILHYNLCGNVNRFLPVQFQWPTAHPQDKQYQLDHLEVLSLHFLV